MKLWPLTYALPSIVPAFSGELLSPSLLNSVCERKKTSLSGWLPLPLTQHLLPDRAFSSRRSPAILAPSPQLPYSNSK